MVCGSPQLPANTLLSENQREYPPHATDVALTPDDTVVSLEIEIFGFVGVRSG